MSKKIETKANTKTKDVGSSCSKHKNKNAKKTRTPSQHMAREQCERKKVELNLIKVITKRMA